MSQSRDEMYMRSLKDTHAELQTIKGSGNGLVIAGIVGAVVLYLGAGLAAFAYFGGDALASLSRSARWFNTTGASFTDVTVKVNTVVSVNVFDS